MELITGSSYGAVTIEAICERARVKKGSFYHFFDSKSDVTAAALRSWWDRHEGAVRELFRPETPPLERIRRYLDWVAEREMKAYREKGRLLGCPFFTLGSEISTQDERLQSVVQEILDRIAAYFAEAIRQAQESGEIEGNNAALKSRWLWAFFEGTLTRGRIENNPEFVRTLAADAHVLLRAPFRLRKETTPSRDEAREIFAELALMGEHAEDMVVLTDAEGHVEWVNDAFVRTCGYTREELRGQKPGPLLQGPASDRAAIELLHAAFHSARPCECRIINYKKDGTPYPVFISVGPVYSGGRLEGFLAVERDLSGIEEVSATGAGIDLR